MEVIEIVLETAKEYWPVIVLYAVFIWTIKIMFPGILKKSIEDMPKGSLRAQVLLVGPLFLAVAIVGIYRLLTS